MRHQPSGRPGFTLLEVTLALAVAVLLMAGLYVALSTLVNQQHQGRIVMDEAGQVRTLFSRLSNDITCHLPPIDPRNVRLPSVVNPATGSSMDKASSSSSTGNTTSSGTTSSSNNSSNTTDPNSSSTTNSEAGDSSQNSNSGGGLQLATFNVGVQGTSDRLTLAITRALQPRELLGEANVGPGAFCDLRRISYWLVPGQDGMGGGLARYEFQQVASDEATADPFAVDDPGRFIIAPDVVGLTFEYFDGQAKTWVQSWDGSQTGTDGKTPRGPPLAIAITVEVRRRAAAAGQPAPTRTFRHVITIPTANGAPNQSSDMGLGG